MFFIQIFFTYTVHIYNFNLSYFIKNTNSSHTNYLSKIKKIALPNSGKTIFIVVVNYFLSVLFLRRFPAKNSAPVAANKEPSKVPLFCSLLPVSGNALASLLFCL